MEKKKLIKQNSNCILPSPLSNGISSSYRGLPLHILINRYTTKFTATAYLDTTMIIPLCYRTGSGTKSQKIRQTGTSRKKNRDLG